jgi:hypothetical protein
MFAAAALITLSTIFFFATHHTRKKLRQKAKWPMVSGTITWRGFGANTDLTRGGDYFLPGAKFTYVVDGKTYEGDTVYAMRGVTFRRDAVMPFVDALPSPLPVHYDPANPAQSYLLVDPSLSGLIFYAAATVLMIIGVLLLLTALV